VLANAFVQKHREHWEEEQRKIQESKRNAGWYGRLWGGVSYSQATLGPSVENTDTWKEIYAAIASDGEQAQQLAGESDVIPPEYVRYKMSVKIDSSSLTLTGSNLERIAVGTVSFFSFAVAKRPTSTKLEMSVQYVTATSSLPPSSPTQFH